MPDVEETRRKLSPLERDAIGAVVSYRARSVAAIEAIDADEVVALVGVLHDLRDMEGMVFVLGNGGSQAAAQHLVLHLREHGIAAIDLLADNASLTALSNDVHYDGAAWRTLKAFRPTLHDVLVVISGSGTSKNCVLATQRFPGTKVGIIGEATHAKQTEDAVLLDYAVRIPGGEYGPMEDATVAVIHAINEALKGMVD